MPSSDEKLYGGMLTRVGRGGGRKGKSDKRTQSVDRRGLGVKTNFDRRLLRAEQPLLSLLRLHRSRTIPMMSDEFCRAKYGFELMYFWSSSGILDLIARLNMHNEARPSEVERVIFRKKPFIWASARKFEFNNGLYWNGRQKGRQIQIEAFRSIEHQLGLLPNNKSSSLKMHRSASLPFTIFLA